MRCDQRGGGRSGRRFSLRPGRGAISGCLLLEPAAVAVALRAELCWLGGLRWEGSGLLA